MARNATLADSFGVGSLHIGIRDTTPQDKRATFQFANDGTPIAVDIFATQDFDFGSNVGSNWFKVTDRAKDTADQDSDFVIVNGNFQWKRPNKLGVPIEAQGVYAFDNGFLPAAFMVSVTSVTSGSPLKILFGV
jgi:hypothetical protein